MNFEGRVAQQTIVKSRGTKYFAKTLALPDVRPGSIIEYSYTYNATLAIKWPDGLKDSTLIAVRNYPKNGALLFFDPTNDLTPFGHLATRRRTMACWSLPTVAH